MKIMTINQFQRYKITPKDYGDEIALINSKEDRVVAILEVKKPDKDIEVERVYSLRVK